MEGDTEALRCLAPQWSLAADKDLLNALQNIHQRIMVKCQETNRKLDEMVTALDSASVHLQNVNNKFTALSNSQFIESRVYDDDTEISTEPTRPTEEPKQASRDSAVEALKRSLQVLEEYHETVTILCDSDSDSSDEESIARVILKPKDLYCNRPLPHIIGSQPWKSKWHAGLLLDESDSDSERSKHELMDQYSDSDPEPYSESQHDTHSQTGRERTISSSSLQSERETSLPSAGPPLTQSDIASDLARRLGATAKMPESNKEESPTNQPAVRKLYKPERPAPAQIFSDEPPPLESEQSESSDEDIFAEISRSQPYSSSRERSTAADDLFGKPVFDDILQKVPNSSVPKQSNPLFDQDSEPELFADKSEKPKPNAAQEDDKPNPVLTKKQIPAGAMSMFGSNANAESIGAAILKRKQRGSTSGDDSDDNQPQPKHTEHKTLPQTKKPEPQKIKQEIDANIENRKKQSKERDIFDDLFARSKKLNNKKEKERVVKEINKPPEKKVDLFSDNLFDDIDDIFTSNITIVKDNNSKQQKSIFDDDDDLFSDIAVVKSNNNQTINKNINTAKTKENKSIFHSNEDLFNEKEETNTKKDNRKVKESVKPSKGLFDDEDDDLFSEVKVKATETKPVTKETVNDVSKKDEPLFTDETDDLFTNKSQKSRPVIDQNKPKVVINENPRGNEVESTKTSVVKSPELFDDDEYDLFTKKSRENKLDVVTDPKIIINDENYKTGEKPKKSAIISSPDLFVDDDDLFLSHPKSKAENKDSNSNATLQDSIKSDNYIPVEQKPSNKKGDTIISPENSANLDEISNPKPEIATKPTVPVQNNKNKFKEDVLDDELFSNSEIKSEVANTTVTSTETLSKTNSNIDDNTFFINKIKPDIAPKLITTVTHIEQTITASDNPTVIAKKVTSIEQTLTKEGKGDAQAFDDLKDLTRDIDNVDKYIEPKTSEKMDKEKTVGLETEVTDLPKDINEVATKDIFSDIFDNQPPVFEKPKEPKKSKNVNALFDDDSDDEALFFRKTDATLDEKPEVFSSPTEDRLFGLFRDEPPPDVDFVQKSLKNDADSPTDEFSDGDNYSGQDKKDIVDSNKVDNVSRKREDNVFRPSNDTVDTKDNTRINKTDESPVKTTKSSYNKEITDKQDIFSDINEDNIFQNPSNAKNIFDEGAKDDFETFLKTDDDLFKPKPKTDAQTPTPNDVKTVEVAEVKKIGKLKPMNFNINVNTLLPGASPKKTNKNVEQTDGQAISTKSNEELRTKDDAEENLESKMVKSVSFEGKHDSEVLDNKLSKERAKIQVKRRPSTRRARREAVKKSGIDFGEDTTDNSSSVDDPPPKVSSKSAQPKVKSDLDNENPNSDATVDTSATFDDVSFEESPAKGEDIKTIVEDILQKDDFDDLFNPKNNAEQDLIENYDDIDDIFKPKEEAKASSNNSVVTESITHVKDVQNTDLDKTKDVSSKLVTQEDEVDNRVTMESINANKTNLTDVKSKVVYVLHDEDIFNTKNEAKSVDSFGRKLETNTIHSGINTLGTVYKDLAQKPDVTIKNEDKTTKKAETRKVEEKPRKIQSIFDSDDDTELFTSKKVEKPMKNSLFASDSDEELFGKKPKAAERKKSEEKVREAENFVAKELKKVPVKTSLFGDEDDDDLFGVKSKKIEPKMQASKPETSKEINKSTEPVFQDPLSLLGSDED